MTDPNEYPASDALEGVLIDHRHVSEDEALEAADPDIGDGAPDTAPWEAPRQTLWERLTGRFKPDPDKE